MLIERSLLQSKRLVLRCFEWAFTLFMVIICNKNKIFGFGFAFSLQNSNFE